MKILGILAHPSNRSFSSSLLDYFLECSEGDAERVNLFSDDTDLRMRIAEAERLCFAFPIWCEMPPSKFVQFFQETFVHGFAFEYIDGNRTLLLNKKATFLLCMGQRAEYNTTNLELACTYCGIEPTFLHFNEVGPNMTIDDVQRHKAKIFDFWIKQ